MSKKNILISLVFILGVLFLLFFTLKIKNNNIEKKELDLTENKVIINKKYRDNVVDKKYKDVLVSINRITKDLLSGDYNISFVGEWGYEDISKLTGERKQIALEYGSIGNNPYLLEKNQNEFIVPGNEYQSYSQIPVGLIYYDDNGSRVDYLTLEEFFNLINGTVKPSHVYYGFTNLENLNQIPFHVLFDDNGKIISIYEQYME
jgi:hypothetical protein